MGSRGNARIQWTEKACLLLVKAVIQVEWEILHDSGAPTIQPSTGKPMGKWERINNLLPPELQGRSQPWSRFKCRGAFDNILKSYRTKKDGKVRKTFSDHLLTEAVHDMMIKREEFLNAGLSIDEQEQTFRSRSSGEARSRSEINGMSQGHSSRGRRSRGTARASRFVTGSRGPADGLHNKPASPHRRSPSRSVGGDFEESEDFQDPSAARPLFQSRARTRAQGRDVISTTRSPSRESMSRRKRITDTSLDERHEGTFCGGQLRRRLELEFSRLGSWVKSRSIPVGERVVSDFTRHKLGSTKRRKLNISTTTEPLDELIRESLSRGLDLGIRASFQQLRVRFAEELRITSIGLGEDFRHGTNELSDFSI